MFWNIKNGRGGADRPAGYIWPGTRASQMGQGRIF